MLSTVKYIMKDETTVRPPIRIQNQRRHEQTMGIIEILDKQGTVMIIRHPMIDTHKYNLRTCTLFFCDTHLS